MMGITLPIIILKLIALANSLIFAVLESSSDIFRVIPSAEVLQHGCALVPAPPLPHYITE